MEKKRTATVNSILDQDEALVERLLTQCEVYGNAIVDRLIAQIKQTGSRNSLALRWDNFCLIFYLFKTGALSIKQLSW